MHFKPMKFMKKCCGPLRAIEFSDLSSIKTTSYFRKFLAFCGEMFISIWTPIYYTQEFIRNLGKPLLDWIHKHTNLFTQFALNNPFKWNEFFEFGILQFNPILFRNSSKFKHCQRRNYWFCQIILMCLNSRTVECVNEHFQRIDEMLSAQLKITVVKNTPHQRMSGNNDRIFKRMIVYGFDRLAVTQAC